MKHHCAIIFIILVSFSCGVKEEKSDQINFFDTTVEINTEVYDSIGFFQKPDQLELISDSLLIGFSSFSGFSIYQLQSGIQLDYVDFKREGLRNYFFSAFDARSFPLVYFLEPKRKTVVLYDVQKKQLVNSVNLDLSEENSIRALGGKFKVYNNEFFIELEPLGVPMLDVKYYEKSGKFLGIFGEDGGQKRKVLEYPKEMRDSSFFFIPANYYSFDIYNDQLFICFPFERKIRIYSLNSDFKEYSSIDLPEIKHIDLALQKIPTKFHPKDYPIEQRLIAPRADKLLVSKGGDIYLSLVMNDNNNSDRFREYVTVWKYDASHQSWSALKDPVDYFDLGNFAGVSNGLLYFFDAAVIAKDEKFINAIRME
ncbi:MAG: hypothetical protein ACXIUD_06455 [Mongoliitalea sp.]